MSIPADDVLMAYLRRAIRLYKEALPNATLLQHSVWRHISQMVFVEEAFEWPFDEQPLTPAVRVIISVAMIRHEKFGKTLERALEEAKRWERRTRNW